MGHDHEYDDNGLPPADEAVVPDDARELDREVQAYHRELRWQRRHERWRAVFAFSRRHGTIGPLLAGVLLLAAVSASLLLLSTRPDTASVQPPSEVAGQNGQAGQSGSPGAIGAPLIDARATIDGRSQHLSALAPAVLTLVPAGCDCVNTLQTVTANARRYGIPVYLVESGRQAPELERLASRLGEKQPPAVLEEPAGRVARAYGGSGLEAVLVSDDGRVGTILDGRALRSETKLGRHLAPLRGSWQTSGGNSPGSGAKPGH